MFIGLTYNTSPIMLQIWQAVMCRQIISGAYHGADLAFLFEMALFMKPLPPLDDDSMEVSKKMLKMWINFAKTG